MNWLDIQGQSHMGSSVNYIVGTISLELIVVYSCNFPL